MENFLRDQDCQTLLRVTFEHRIDSASREEFLLTHDGPIPLELGFERVSESASAKAEIRPVLVPNSRIRPITGESLAVA